MVEITMLGSFAVAIDGVTVDSSHWRRKASASLIKLLALAPNRRLHREQVLDQLWPDLSPGDAAPRLHKAVHLARRALGAHAIGTTGEMLQLLPDSQVRIDVIEFETAATSALDSEARIDKAIERYTGELLPDDRYEPWAETRRQHLAHLHRQILRAGRRYAELVAVDPTDEDAHVALMRAFVDRGDRAGALSQYERLTVALEEELGVEPGEQARALREEAAAISPSAALGDGDGDDDALPIQEIRFCHAADGVRLAYAVTGSGPPLVKAANWLSHLEYDWESSIWRHWLSAFNRRFRMLRYDERGCGLSDWNTTSFAIDAWVDDLTTVSDAAGFDRFTLLGISQGAAVAVEYAAQHPERVQALVLYGGYVHGPVARAKTDEEQRIARLLPDLAELGWGRDEATFRQVFTARFMPGGSREQWDEFNDLQLRSTSASNAARFLRGFANIDISASAAKVQCPALVVHVRDDRSPPLEQGRLLASLIPGSRFVSLEGDNHLMLADEPAWPRFLQEVDRFLAEI